MDSSEKFSQMNNNGLNLKATELRLGLPGSESPEREASDEKDKNSYPLCMFKSLISGAKRGFSDAIVGGSGKWILSGNSGSEMASVVKEKIPQSSNPLNEKKKPQIISPPAPK